MTMRTTSAGRRPGRHRAAALLAGLILAPAAPIEAEDLPPAPAPALAAPAGLPALAPAASLAIPPALATSIPSRLAWRSGATHGGFPCLAQMRGRPLDAITTFVPPDQGFRGMV